MYREEEVIEEEIEKNSVESGEETEYLAEDIEIEGLIISDVEQFISRAEVWDNLLQNKISINEAQNIFTSLIQQTEKTKTTTKRSRRKKS